MIHLEKARKILEVAPLLRGVKCSPSAKVSGGTDTEAITEGGILSLWVCLLGRLKPL